MTRSLVILVFVGIAFVTGAVSPTRARAEAPLPAQLSGIEIDERPGALLPRDVPLRDHDGNAVTLGSYLDGRRPVLLVLAYYECPMLCSLVLNGVKDGIAGLAWTAGKDFRVVTVSFDPRDTPEAARNKRVNYLDSYGRHVDDKGWDFLVGDASDVRRIADAVGFKYRWDPEGKQFAHAAGAFVITPDGRLSRTLHGVFFPTRDLRLALTEASAGKLGAAWDRVLLLCFHYDPNAKSYVVATTRLVRALGVVTVVVLGAWLARFWRNERGRQLPLPSTGPRENLLS